tara:strand:- start:23 stop:226 length:204 start_codon:yes stop_codon:yes gene_type:complete
MRALIIAMTLRIFLLSIASFLLMILWFGTGADRSPIGLLIGMTIAGLAGLWWFELQIQKALKLAAGE